ncbi:hypothetical protein LIER_18362 [Lithospermum erythrorhizon]|uniref:Pentatricopeptide repeat-containing protein n=1 Tax=Lithospermum erythrorhizon TaxID=34254 RepID=A0AAV3QGI7_LITER
MSLYGKSDMFGHVQKVFGEMPDRNMQRSTKTMNALLSACVEKGVKMFDEMEKNGVNPDLVRINTVLVGLYSNKRFLEGEKMSRRMIEKVKGVSQLDTTGLKPDAFTYRALIRGYYHKGNLKEAKYWYAELIRCECHRDKVTTETVVSFAMKKGDLSCIFSIRSPFYRCYKLNMPSKQLN